MNFTTATQKGELVVQGVQREEVTLVPYDEAWGRKYEQERDLLISIIGEQIVAIEHFGSTAIKGIQTKPVIDILIGVETLAASDQFDRKALAQEKYYQLGQVEQEGKVVFAKFPALPDTRRTHYLHVVEHGGAWWKSHIGFRDALRNDLALAKEYEQLKKKLAAYYPNNVRAYTEEKEQWIQSIVP